MGENSEDENLRFDENSVYEVDPECVVCLNESLEKREYPTCSQETKRSFNVGLLLVILLFCNGC